VGFEALQSLEMLRFADLVTWCYMTDGMKMQKHCCVNLNSVFLMACGKEVRLGKGARVAWVGRATRAVVRLVLGSPDI